MTQTEEERELDQVVLQKMEDAAWPGLVVPFDPDEAERAGVFVEQALTDDEAAAAAYDLPEVE